MTNSESVEIYVGPNSIVTEVTIELSDQKLTELWEEFTTDDNRCITGCGERVRYGRKICGNCLLDALEEYHTELADEIQEILGE